MRVGYNHWNANIPVFLCFASLSIASFMLNTQNTPQLPNSVAEKWFMSRKTYIGP